MLNKEKIVRGLAAVFGAAVSIVMAAFGINIESRHDEMLSDRLDEEFEDKKDEVRENDENESKYREFDENESEDRESEETW